MGEKELPLKETPFKEAALKILDEESEAAYPNMAKCVMAVGYAVVALVDCLEEDIDSTLESGLRDIRHAIDSIIKA